MTGSPALGKEVPVPVHILANLRPGYGQRPYQREAFARFVQRMADGVPNGPAHLLFHMATGSGKTMIMAGCILHLYRLGFRHFIFFVNSTNIIEKTRGNFLDPRSPKYLFARSVTIDGRPVAIREVEDFATADPQGINILFSTIQGLHATLQTPRENAVTFQDLAGRRLALISDEAHHINAETRQARFAQQDVASWEATAQRLLGAAPGNVMIEFTATADLAHPAVARKYRDKLLFDYPLRSFHADRYSKEVKVLQSDRPLMDRALMALILGQYRRKVFARHGHLVKPVVLFKSRTIADSIRFHGEFLAVVGTLDGARLRQLETNAPAGAMGRAWAFFRSEGIDLDDLAVELRSDFSSDRCLVVNSREESEAAQIAVNTLEDPANPYRAIFAVDKLNEGWDVLNLFDIVRLYDTRQAKAGKPGRTTMSEAQLIGRGARYFPFPWDGRAADRRKFDDDQGHPLRIGEELYYHSAYNPSYIQELGRAMEEVGLPITEDAERPVRATGHRKAVAAKPQKEKRAQGLPAFVRKRRYRVALAGTAEGATSLLGGKETGDQPRQERELQLTSLGLPVILKAIDRSAFFRFDTLQQRFPSLQSMREFIAADDYLGGVRVIVEGPAGNVQDLSPEQRLRIATQVLEKIVEGLLE